MATFDWTSNGSGDYTEAITLNGIILRVVTNPGATAPTDNYDVTLIGPDGEDLFNSQGLNRDTANTEQFCPGITFSDGTNTTVIPVAHAGAATLTIANAGASKVGTVTIYYKP